MTMAIIKSAFNRLATFFPRSKSTPQKDSFDDELGSIGWSFEHWRNRYSDRHCIYTDIDAQSLTFLKTHFEPQVSTTIADADRVMNHEFDLLGSGPFSPIDSTRPPQENGYIPIDWFLDPIQNLRFPRDVPHREWDLFKMRPGNADIKLPWELSRCQHFVALGQAFRLTDQIEYALEITDQIHDFMEVNPVGLGINWTCTMDVAIRAANWAIGLDLIKRCPDIQDDAWHFLYSRLFDHGSFIYNNFENHYEVTSNHYLSNLVGLFFLSSIFEGLPSADGWSRYCRNAIATEIDIQILPDGADFESSIPYHRLVLELFLGAARLAEIQGDNFPPNYYRTLIKMADFLFGVMRPDGLMPVVGDADDGRLHIFTSYGQWDRQDGRHVLAPAAVMMQKDQWLAGSGQDERWETVWWGLDAGNVGKDVDAIIPASCNHYADAGLSVLRNGGDYLLITNSIVGTQGFGNHKHNDQLSFEYHCDHVPLIVDPGSYVYTSDFASRNLFRSTAYHNTIRVDGEEQNEFNPEWLFRMFEKSDPEHLYVGDESEYFEYIGQHGGYRRLNQAVFHKRRFRYLKAQSLLLIMDVLEGQGTHDLEWHFHFAPGLALFLDRKDQIRIEVAGKKFFLTHPPRLKANLQEGWHSSSYGVRQNCRYLTLQETKAIRSSSEWLFSIGRYDDGTDEISSDLINYHHLQMKRDKDRCE